MLNQPQLSRLRYYRSCLADADRMDFDVKSVEEGAVFVPSLKTMPPGEVAKLFGKADAEARFKDVCISPFRLLPRVADNQKSFRQRIWPFWIPARISREGAFSPPEDTRLFPWLVRSVLEPNDASGGDYPTLCSADHSDEVASGAVFSLDSFEAYMASCRQYFRALCGSDERELSFEDWTVDTKVFTVFPAGIKGAAARLIELYDHLLSLPPPEPAAPMSLLARLLDFSAGAARGVEDPQPFVCSPVHYGQMGKQFPLSPSQRVTLSLHGSAGPGAILAVNGPPGTGKTTLLQSVCANLIVRTVLAEKRPPLLLACSTNNKAITNILDSFKSVAPASDGSPGLDARWLPDLDSIGILASNGTALIDDAHAKGYPVYSASAFANENYYKAYTESHPLMNCEAYFLAQFRSCFPGVSVQGIPAAVDALYGFLQERVARIDALLASAGQVLEACARFGVDPSSPRGLEREFERLRDRLDRTGASLRGLIVSEALSPEAPSALKRLAGKFRGSASDDRSARIRAALEELGIGTDPDDGRDICSLAAKVFAAVEANRASAASAAGLRAALDAALADLSPFLSGDPSSAPWWETMNAALDQTVRYEAFWLALHFLEGDWLRTRDDEAYGKLNRGERAQRGNFAAMSYLTPFFVSTFHTAPSIFCCFKGDASGSMHRLPLLGLADLLVVDEAGQVAPDIGVPVFCLGKKALVVGDVRQIEPVWSMPNEALDRGNAARAGLCADGLAYAAFKASNEGCLNGSLMRLAQRASAYRYPAASDMAGSLLVEHRRCVPEIIEYSNRFVYNGLLEVKTGSIAEVRAKRPADSAAAASLRSLPALGYCHIPGESENRSGSQRNEAEAAAIALWVSVNKEALEALYPKEPGLSSILAIVTPFSAQRDRLKEVLAENGVDCAGLTIGTVHALQGAERPVILFSPVYGKNAAPGTLFFDRGYNMLNVALSRAKHHFLVFGCVSHFNRPQTHCPSSDLGALLFADPENEISSSFYYDKSERTPLRKFAADRLSTLAKHRGTLRRAFEIVERRLIIVSPFISEAALLDDKIPEEIAAAKARGAEVIVVTDMNLDMRDGRLKDASRKGRELLEKSGAVLAVKNGIHSKILIIDAKVIVEGSFNWLSASRDAKSAFHRYESSIVVQEPSSKEMIESALEELGFAEKKAPPEA